MAFVPSIDSVIAAIQLVNDIYQKTKNAPHEIADAIKDVRSMKAELESMKEKVGDEKYFVKQNGPEMLASIVDTFAPLEEDLHNMRRLIRKFNNTPPYTVQRTIFANFKMPDVKEIQESFNKYRAIYATAFHHAGAVADAHNAAELEAINRKLEIKNKQYARNFAELKRQQQEAAKIQKENDVKVDKALQMLEKIAKATAPKTSSTAPSKADMENQLIDSGMKREDVKKIMGPLIWASQDITQDALRITVAVDGTTKNNTKASDPSHRRLSQGSMKKPEGLKAPGMSKPRSISQTRDGNTKGSFLPPAQSSHTALKPQALGPETAKQAKKPNLKSPSPVLINEEKAVSSPPKPSKTYRGYTWILFIDRTNGFHSILAQTYLELLRMWTANASKSNPPTWLFSRVASCDANIPTELTTNPSLSPPFLLSPTNPSPKSSPARPTMAAVTALTSPESYFRSTEYPFEKNALVERIARQAKTRRGITRLEFEQFDYICCFDQAVHNDLERLQAFVNAGKDIPSPSGTPGPASANKRSPTKAKLLLLPGSARFVPTVHTSPPQLQQLVSSVRSSVQSFASTYLCWQRPEKSFQHGPYRTLQLVLPRKYRDKLLERIGTGRVARTNAVVEGVVEMQGCWVWLTWEGDESGRQLVCVTGPIEKLVKAEGWVRGLC